MPPPTRTPHPGHRRRHEREQRRAAITTSTTLILLTLLAWLTAPRLETTTFWTEHVPALDLRLLVLLTGSLLAIAPALRLVWPGTREADWLARNARALATATLLALTVGQGLEAPRLAAAIVLVPLLAPGAAFARFLAHSRLPLGPPAFALGIHTAATLAYVVGTGGATLTWTLALTLPAALTHLVGGPLTIHHWRRRLARDAQRFDRAGRLRDDGPDARLATRLAELDLPHGVLDPGAGLFGTSIAIALVLFIGIVMAPGVPVGNFVRWLALTLLFPIILHGTLRRNGVVHDRLTLAPAETEAHHAIVTDLPDERLARLDGPMESFVTTGFGRRRLARELADVLAPVLPDLAAGTVLKRLRRAPYGWGRRARRKRETHIARMLGVDPLHTPKPTDTTMTPTTRHAEAAP